MKLITLAWCLLVLAAGCVHVSKYTRYSEPQEVESQSAVSPTAYVNASPTFDSVLPFFLLTKSSNSPPYSLTVSIDDSTGTCRYLTIDEIEVTYDDGTSISVPHLPVSIEFYEESAQHVTPEILDRESDFTLRLRGSCTRVDGSQIPFDGSRHFEAKTVINMLPVVVVLNGV